MASEMPKALPRDYYKQFPRGEPTRGEPGRGRRAAALMAQLALAIEARRRQSRFNTQADLAAAAEVSRHTITRLEAGSTWSNLSVLLKLGDVLGLELKYEARPESAAPDDPVEGDAHR